MFLVGLLPMGAVFAEPAEEPSIGQAGLWAQTITFGLPQSGLVDEASALDGSADSGLPLDYRSDTPRRCAIAKGKLRFKDAGTCTVTAS